MRAVDRTGSYGAALPGAAQRAVLLLALEVPAAHWRVDSRKDQRAEGCLVLRLADRGDGGMDGRLAGRTAARWAGVDLNADGRMGVAGVARSARGVRDAHGGKRRIVGHRRGRADHRDATEGGAEGGEGRSSLKVLLVAHVGRVWSRPGCLEDPARTLEPVSCGGVAV